VKNSTLSAVPAAPSMSLGYPYSELNVVHPLPPYAALDLALPLLDAGQALLEAMACACAIDPLSIETLAPALRHVAGMLATAKAALACLEER
jgi:hypothetical protein